MKSGAKITIPLLLILIISGCISSSPSPHLPQHHEQAKYTTIQVYFAPFSDETVSTIIALINSSNKSIHAAVYDLDPIGLCPKTLRKTWESWLVFYPRHIHLIFLSQGHNNLTSLQHYINLPFTEQDRKEMRK